jgi:hypothetical protein
LIFGRPFAVRARDHDLKLKHDLVENFTGRCFFSERSEWIDEFIFDQRLGFFTPTHYVFDLIDNFIELMGDNSRTVEEIPNEGISGELQSLIVGLPSRSWLRSTTCSLWRQGDSNP